MFLFSFYERVIARWFRLYSHEDRLNEERFFIHSEDFPPPCLVLPENIFTSFTLCYSLHFLIEKKPRELNKKEQYKGNRERETSRKKGKSRYFLASAVSSTNKRSDSFCFLLPQFCFLCLIPYTRVYLCLHIKMDLRMFRASSQSSRINLLLIYKYNIIVILIITRRVCTVHCTRDVLDE